MFQLQRVGSHDIIVPTIKTIKRLRATMRGSIIITEVRGMGEHLLCVKPLHSGRKSIPKKGDR